MAKQEYEIRDVDLFGEWRLVEGGYNGTMEKILSYDPETGNYTRLLKFPPKTDMPEVLTHDFCEEIYVVDGYLTDTKKKPDHVKRLLWFPPSRNAAWSLQHSSRMHNNGIPLPGSRQAH